MKESLKLLSQRERREVLGRNYMNLWMLVIVITATFLSIAFSNASMKYLSDKMDDPFTNWVDKRFAKEVSENLLRDLNDPDTQSRFRIKSFQTDYVEDKTFYNSKWQGSVVLKYRSVRSLDDSDIIRAILDDDNLVRHAPVINRDSIPDTTFGVIISADALKKLGHDPNDPPAYIYRTALSEYADTLGVLHMFQSDPYTGHYKYAPAPLPVLAVVKRLPGEYDFFSTYLFREESERYGTSFNMNNREYRTDLTYFVPQNLVEEFKASLPQILPNHSGIQTYPAPDKYDAVRPAMPGELISVFPFGYDTLHSVDEYNAVEKAINERWGYGKNVYRVWAYSQEGEPASFKDYLSIYFERLDSIRPFEQYMKNEHKIVVDMEQINAKENFNAVSVMATILSTAMIIFSIVCIILFIVNMLQSYFQKVKRNMGTFKAFGISTSELISVYVMMIFAIVTGAIVAGLLVTWIIELLLPALGFLKDGRYNYLLLWNGKTIVSALIMMGATAVTVYITMKSLLRKTPGDLIYDR